MNMHLRKLAKILTKKVERFLLRPYKLDYRQDNLWDTLEVSKIDAEKIITMVYRNLQNSRLIVEQQVEVSLYQRCEIVLVHVRKTRHSELAEDLIKGLYEILEIIKEK